MPQDCRKATNNTISMRVAELLKRDPSLTVAQLAARFGVSKDGMRVRLKSLGLRAGKDDQRLHYTVSSDVPTVPHWMKKTKRRKLQGGGLSA